MAGEERPSNCEAGGSLTSPGPSWGSGLCKMGGISPVWFRLRKMGLPGIRRKNRPQILAIKKASKSTSGPHNGRVNWGTSTQITFSKSQLETEVASCAVDVEVAMGPLPWQWVEHGEITPLLKQSLITNAVVCQKWQQHRKDR